MPFVVTRCSPARFTRAVTQFNWVQRVSTLETLLGSLHQIQSLKMNCNFCALLLSKFNPDLRRLKVDESRYILITEVDVEEILGLRDEGFDVPMIGEPSQLGSLASICDPRHGSPKVVALES